MAVPDQQEHIQLSNPKSFLYKTGCSFVITSQVILPEKITQELGIEPRRSHKKGPFRYTNQKSDTIYTYQSHLWEISSVEAIQDQGSILPHVYYVRRMLESKLDILDQYKQDPRYESIISIRHETETGKVGVGLNEDELAFIRRICNRFSCFLFSTSVEDSDD